MPEIKELLDEYRITGIDIQNIKTVSPFLLDRKEEVADFHYSKLLGDEETARFFADEHTLDRARKAFLSWFDDLVSGDYTDAYPIKLARTGGAHVSIGLPAHYVNISMSRLREHLADLIRWKYGDSPETASQVVSSLNKILDMNLDLMTRSYREEELRVNFLSRKLDSGIITFAKWITHSFNMVLVGGLVVIGLMTLLLAFQDIKHLLSEVPEKGVLGALGTLLILWVVIELLDTQIGHIKGRGFAVKVFVSVALVAELRRILLTSIEHTDWKQDAVLVSSVLMLGVVYWLTSKVEK